MDSIQIEKYGKYDLHYATTNLSEFSSSHIADDINLKGLKPINGNSQQTINNNNNEPTNHRI